MADDIKWTEQKEHSEESRNLQQDVELRQHKQVSVMDVIKEAKVYILDNAFMSQSMQCRSNLFLCQPHFYSCCFMMRAIALYCLVWDS